MTTTTSDISIKGVFSYGTAYIADIMSSQFFSFLIFTFYFAIIGVETNLITIGFIIWSMWNAINDPLMGSLSDRTKTRWGKRKPWIVAGIAPTCLILIFIWMPPMTSGIDNFWFMLVMILLFDTFFTMYSLNQTALFPEMYQDLHQRAKANQIIQILGVVALIVATLLPG
nr:MFS transporter [Candidatus Sigynarchaeota archaeon]